MTDQQKFNKLELNRIEKLENIQSKGIDPFPARTERTHTSQEAKDAFEAIEKSGEEKEISATLVGTCCA